MNVLGIIPARGGSKGIPDKNIKDLCGIPLIGWVCTEAKKAQHITDLILSTDSERIIEVVKQYNIDVPFRRPDALAQDTTLVVDVIIHALEWMQENRGKKYDYVCLCQPTAPLVKALDYDKAITLAYEKKADTIISVEKCDQRHPAIMYNLDSDGKASWFMDDTKYRGCRRQDLPPVYLRAGLVYVISTENLLSKHSIYGEKLYAIEVPSERAIGIDSPIDFIIADAIIKSGITDK